MKLIERVDLFANSFYTALGVSFAGGVVWLIRQVFTNQSLLRQLQGEIAAREATRNEERKLLDEIRSDVRELYRRDQWRYQHDPRGDAGRRLRDSSE